MKFHKYMHTTHDTFRLITFSSSLFDSQVIENVRNRRKDLKKSSI